MLVFPINCLDDKYVVGTIGAGFAAVPDITAFFDCAWIMADWATAAATLAPEPWDTGLDPWNKIIDNTNSKLWKANIDYNVLVIFVQCSTACSTVHMQHALEE